MIQTLRQIRTRIRSIENTRKITRAMEMISAAKLNRVKKMFYASRPYFFNLESILRGLLSDTKCIHPLLEKRQERKNVALCVITSDTGLCGTHNHNLLRAASAFLESHNKNQIRLITVGKAAFSYFHKRDFFVENAYLGLYGRYSAQVSDSITKNLIDIFSSGEADEVYVAYTHFSSSLRHNPVVEKFLNIEFDEKRRVRYILEPNADDILEEMIPKFLITRMRVILLDAFTSEHSARMFAMHNATDNADGLIDTLTLARNKARQAAITKEVLEIAMSAEALKG